MKRTLQKNLAVAAIALGAIGSANAQYLTNALTTVSANNVNPYSDFTLNLQSPGSGTNAVAFTANGVTFLYPNDNNRNLLTSLYNTYDQTNFEATVDCNANNAFAGFFGIGQGVPNSEPQNSVYMRFRQSGGAVTVQNGPFSGLGSFSAFGGGVSAPFTAKITYSATYRLILFTIIKGTTTNSVGPLTIPTLSSGYSVFLGGNNNDTFTNLVVRAPSSPLAATNAMFTTPRPTLYVGYPAPKQFVAAQFNIGLTSDITSDLNTSYSSTDPTICDVASFGGALTPVNGGVCQIIATNSGMGVSATQTVTVVSTSPDINMTNLFTGTAGLTMPTNMQLNLGRFVNTVQFTTNGVVFAGNGDQDRSFLATAYNAYNGQDFQADVDCNTNVSFASFFGIGRAENTASGNEPANSAYLRVRFSGAQPQIMGVTAPAYTAWPGGLGAGPVHLKMLYTVGSGQVAFTISTPTTNQTVSVSMSSIQTAASGGGKGLRIFVGGSGNGTTAFDTFANLIIKTPGVVVTNLYFVNTPFTNLYVSDAAAHQLQVYGNLANGTPVEMTPYCAFNLVNYTAVSVDSAGVITVLDTPATDTVTATYTGPSTILAATQPVEVLAPVAVRIVLPPIYEGCRAASAVLRADFTATLTNVNVTGYRNVSFSAQGLGNISVAGNSVTPVLAGGPEELYGQYYTLTATNAVTVLGVPAYYRTDSFTGSSLPSGYYPENQNASSPGATVTPSGTVFVNAPASTRDYVISAIPFYNESNFVATITLKTNSPFGAFFGIGRGLGGGSFGEPPNSVYFRARHNTSNPDVQGVGGVFTKWPGGLGNGPLVLRMTYVNDTVNATNAIWFTIITGDANETIGPFTLPVLSQGYSIFFGGAEVDREMTFSDLKIEPTLSTPSSGTLNHQFSGSQLTLSWSSGLLQQATNLVGPWTATPGGNSPFKVTIDPANPQQFYRLLIP